jgi:hypothetical protein
MATMIAMGIKHTLDDSYPDDVSQDVKDYVDAIVRDGAATVLHAMGQDQSQAASLYLQLLENLAKDAAAPKLLPTFTELLVADQMPADKARRFVAEHGDDNFGKTNIEGQPTHREPKQRGA